MIASTRLEKVFTVSSIPATSFLSPTSFADLDPLLVLRKLDLHLHLFTIGYAALETIGAFKYPAKVRRVPGVNRQAQFPVNHIM